MDANILDAWQCFVPKPVLDFNAEPAGTKRFLDVQIGKSFGQAVERTPTRSKPSAARLAQSPVDGIQPIGSIGRFRSDVQPHVLIGVKIGMPNADFQLHAFGHIVTQTVLKIERFVQIPTL